MTEVMSWGSAAGQGLSRSPGDCQSARKRGFRLLSRTMIRHADRPSAVMAISRRMHGTSSRGCLITSASFSLPVTTSFPGASSHAVDLTSVALRADKHLAQTATANEHSADYSINACGRACPADAIHTVFGHLVQQLPTSPADSNPRTFCVS